MNFAIRYNEPLAKYTSFRVGGKADVFFKPNNLQELINFLKTEKPNNLMCLGLGSNVLIRDGGIRGTVISLANQLKALELNQDSIYAEAGVSCAKLSRFADKNGFDGAEFLSGIPGTVGGALAMNAGAFGGETWNLVKSVTVINNRGELKNLTKDDFDINYRIAKPKDKQQFYFVAAEFINRANNQKNCIKELLQRRNKNQPIGLPSCGSVFKNPQGKYSAQLIEKSNLKGFCIGKACVSEKHANFIINRGGATADDIEKLIIHIQKEVKAKFDIDLETEVRIVGQKLCN